MLEDWKKGSDTVLSQIALQSFVELQSVEAMEKNLIAQFLKEKKKEENEIEKRRKELEKAGLPDYKGEIQSDLETEVFVKVCKPYIDVQKLPLLKNMYAVAGYKQLKEEGVHNFLSHLDDHESSTVRSIEFIYRIFKNEPFRLQDNPAPASFRSNLFIVLANPTVQATNRNLLKAFASFLISTDTLTAVERAVIFSKIKVGSQGWLRTSFTLARYPILFLPIIMMLLYIISKII